jgi:hypothetical protein
MFTMMKDITVSTVIPVPDEGEGDTATDEGND